MRALVLAALACVAVPAPALAQDIDRDARILADELGDPVRQAQAAVMAQAVAGAVLDMPVGPLLRAAEAMAGEEPEHIDPDLRVGDLVGPEVADTPRQVAERLPQMMGAMAGFAIALEGMLPHLREAVERAGRVYGSE